jgi:putative phosphoesterase
MKRIGLISDTHTFINPKLYDFFKNVDEIWHAGDIGNIETLNKLREFKAVKAVYGNIDGQDIRIEYPKFNIFSCEDVKVLLTHVGGYPNRYAPGIKDLLIKHKPKLFICGHSHILKVINDKKLNLLHMNPGAAGNSGLHKHITMLRFIIDGKNIKDLEVFELARNL